VYRLLEAGADPNAADMEGEPIIFQIINIRNLNMLKKFRAVGANFDVRNNYGSSPLGHVNATYYEPREAIIEYLLEEGLDPNYATVEQLKKKRPYWTPLMKAADAGNVKRCQRLLAAGADPRVKNLPGRTAAIIAERAGYYQLAQELKAAEGDFETLK
jgi:ankyrin repeat protein